MALNYAESYSSDLLEVLKQGALTSPFITENVKWLDARTFHFTQMSVGGFRNHNRAGGWNKGEFAQKDVSFTVNHDRDVSFLVDSADVDETNQTASVQNISTTFEQTQQVPETDALFFSKVAQAAQKTKKYHSETPIGDYTKENVFGKLKGMLSAGKLRRYKANGSLMMYVNTDIMDLLEQSTAFTRTIEMTQLAEGGAGVETRVTYIDGVPVVEVIDDERFCDNFDFEPDNAMLSFAPVKATYKQTEDTEVVKGKTYYTKSGEDYTAVGSPTKSNIGTYYEIDAATHKINVLIASLQTVKTVPKIASIYFFAPGTHTEGDGYLYQNRQLSDTFVFPNGADGEIDSVYVDTDTEIQ